MTNGIDEADARPYETPPQPDAPARAVGPRGFTVLAWTLVALLVALKVAIGAILSGPPAEVNGEDPIGELLMRIQSRYAVGATSFPGGNSAMILAQMEQFDTGTIGQRQRFIVLAAELAGPVEARARLDGLADLIARERDATAGSAAPFEPSEADAEVMRILGGLYPPVAPVELGSDDGGETAGVADVAAVSAADRTVLVDRLGWFGELALAPSGADEAARDAALRPALATFGILIGVFIAGAAVGFGGFVGLIVVVVLALIGRIRGGLERSGGHHGVYAETFALWLGAFLLIQVAIGLVPLGPEAQLGAVVVGFFASLVILAWPVVRGIPWTTVRHDIGWTLGRKPVLEPVLGVAGYAMGLTLLAVGVILTFGLLAVDAAFAAESETFAPSGGPSHPVIPEVAGGNLLMVLLILLLGSVAAPIVEETMFRGVLYRHLRDATAGLRTISSIAIASLLNAFVFAAIHPQGWVAVPALMSLAVAFSLAREWRGTLVPAILMHGISNGIILGLMGVLGSV
jgi:membrane protease YdiL (CAAX protease family)